MIASRPNLGGALLVLLALAACSQGSPVVDPRLNAGVSIGSGGVSVHPSLSGRLGGLRVGISP